jgi:retron-type reverse transcriptase
LLEEVLRLILDAYYDPQFSKHSHGFRRGRGCHTALREVYHGWVGTAWFIELDVAQFFDRLSHDVLVGILAERIHDGRFLRLIAALLKAGYLEKGRFSVTLSGVPQGGIVSPRQRLPRSVGSVGRINLAPRLHSGRPSPTQSRV